MNIIVSGASSGIGFQAVLHLLQQPRNRVIALARNEAKLDTLKKESASENLHTLPFDIASGDYDQVLLPFVKQCLDTVDVLINNAGQLINQSFANTSIEDFGRLMESNFIGHVRMIKAIVPFMKDGGHIVNIGSMGGYQGSKKFAGLAAYSASKAALHALTECLALELCDQQIKVNCLALGSAQTDMLEQAFPGYQSPVSAAEMGRYIADFALTGHHFYNGKILPVASTTP